MKPMRLDHSETVHAPRPEAITLPGFFRATNGDICTNYCGTLIAVSKIPGSDAVRISMSSPGDLGDLWSVDWEEECNTHEKMLEWIQKMCHEAYEQSRKR